MNILSYSIPALLLSVILIGSCTSDPNQDPPLPNILFAIADDASFPHMGAYGTPWVNTPAFDRVAKGGLLFMNAYTPNAKCAPSRACILTGRNSWQLEEACNHLPYFPEKFVTFAESLPVAGYHVGYTAKGWAPGIAQKDGQPRDLIGKKYNEHKLQPPAKFMSNNDYSMNFQSFLKDRQEGQPFFFWYGSTEPHRAYEFEAGIKYGNKKLSDIDEVPAFWPDTDSIRKDMLDYAFEIEYFDSHLQEMLNHLEEIGELDNTIVIVTADNGMPFPRIKGQVYEMDNHLPLAIMWPNGIKNPGRKIESIVSFIDFAPTFLEVANLELSRTDMQPITGKSLLPIFNNTTTVHRDHMLVGKERHDVGRPHDQGYPVRGIIKDEYLFVQNFKPDRWPAGNPETGYLNTDGSPTKTYILDHRLDEDLRQHWRWAFGKRPEVELYYLINDPYCINNLADDPDMEKMLSTLKEEMYDQLKAEGDPRVLGNGDVFDNYPPTQNAGFYEKFMAGDKLNTGWVNQSDYEKVGEIID